MPYNYNPEEEEKESGQQSLSTTQTPVMGAGGGASQSNPQMQEGKGSGRFTNLNQYLTANKEQAANLSGGIASEVEKEGEKAREGLSSLSSQYEQEVSKPTQFINERFQQVPQDTNVSEEDITKAAQLRENKSQADKQIQQMEAYNPAMAQVEKAKQQAANLGSETGRFATLSDYVKSRGVQNYGKGMQKFDQMLLQSDPTAAGRFQQVQENLKDLQTKPQEEMQRLGDIQKQTQERINQNLANINQFSQQGLGGLQSGLTSKMEEFNKNMADQSEYTKQFQDYLKAKGINPSTYSDINPLQYMQFNPYRASSINEFATQEDLAKANALSRLAGIDNSILSDQNLGSALGQKEFLGANLASPQSRVDEFRRQIDNLNQQKAREMEQVFVDIGNAPIPQYAYEQLINNMRPSLQAEFDEAYSPLIQQEQDKINKYNNLINFLKGVK